MWWTICVFIWTLFLVYIYILLLLCRNYNINKRNITASQLNIDAGLTPQQLQQQHTPEILEGYIKHLERNEVEMRGYDELWIVYYYIIYIIVIFNTKYYSSFQMLIKFISPNFICVYLF